MALKPWKILNSKYIRPGFRFDQCELPNGGMLEAVALEFQTWAVVVALTPEQQVVLIRQYRHGAREVLWEFPGGVVEQDESPHAGARRELLEETGYTAPDLIEVGKFYPNPALQTNRLHVYLARDVQKTGIQKLDQAEDIEIHLVSLEQLLTMTRHGEFCHGLQVAALFHVLAYLGRL